MGEFFNSLICEFVNSLIWECGNALMWECVSTLLLPSVVTMLWLGIANRFALLSLNAWFGQASTQAWQSPQRFAMGVSYWSAG